MRITTLLTLTATAAAVALPPADVPEVETLPSIIREGSIVKKIRYGPRKLNKAEGTIEDVKGVKTTIVLPSIKKPCDDCTLLSMSAGVSNADGSDATAPAIYLHHAAIINLGPEAKDGTCGRKGYDLFFSSGNERSRIIYNNPNSTMPAGYYINKSDNFIIQSEIVNNEFEDKQVYVYFVFEYIPGKQPGHMQTKIAWLSASGASPCSTSLNLAGLLNAPKSTATPQNSTLGAGELWPPEDKVFTLRSAEWISPWSGNFVALGGHLHDGGLNTEIWQNGKLLCDSQARYVTGGTSAMAQGHHGGSSNARHIQSMSGCRSSAAVQAGDKFNIVVNYDFEKNPGLVDKNNKLLPIMAAATLFIATT